MDKENIIIGFSKPKKWKPFAWLIMMGLNIPYSHVYVKYYSKKYERFVIYQASHSLVNFTSPIIFEEENLIVDEFQVPIGAPNKVGMVKFCMDNAGKGYGKKQAFGMALVRIAELFGKTIKNPFSDSGTTYVCSELGGYIIVNFTEIQIDKNLDDLTPKDLYKILMDIKKLQKEVIDYGNND